MTRTPYDETPLGYAALCREAERLGIPTSLDNANTPATVAELRAAVNAETERRLSAWVRLAK